MRPMWISTDTAQTLGVDRAPTLTMLDTSHYDGLVRRNS